MKKLRKGVPEDYVITHVTGAKYLLAKFVNDEPQSKYLVELTSTGYVCECPAYAYSDNRPDFRECKHGKMLLAAIKDGRIVDFRGDPPLEEEEDLDQDEEHNRENFEDD